MYEYMYMSAYMYIEQYTSVYVLGSRYNKRIRILNEMFI